MLTEDAHEKRLRKGDRLTDTLERLRFNFWLEYNYAQENLTKMKVDRLVSGVCLSPYFYHHIMLEKNTDLFTYICCPPTSYEAEMKTIHHKLMKKMREIAKADIFDDEGRLIPATANAVTKAFALMDLRVQGAQVQRVEHNVKQVSYNVNASTPLPDSERKQIERMSEEELDEKLAKMRSELGINRKMQGALDYKTVKGDASPILETTHRRVESDE